MRAITGRRLAIWVMLGICLGMVGARLRERDQTVGPGGFLVKTGYPAVVYVPDYQTGPQLSAASAVLLEATTGTVLYGHGEHQRRAPASTTKIMTALVALEKGDLDAMVTVGRKASLTPGSTLGLRAGDRISLGELLQGMMLRSGNDASVAVAEYIAGSEQAFVDLMNKLALEFGAFNTHFRNPHGLTAVGHYTTAFDLALIARYAVQNPMFAHLVSTKEENLVWDDGSRQSPISNTNKLLWSFAGADGIKTGTTSEAGHCLVASATRDGRRLIAVVLRSGNRWSDAAALLEYGFSSFHLLTLAEEDQAVASIKVDGGEAPQIDLVPRSRLAAVCRSGQENLITTVLSVPEEVQAPVRPGQILGRLTAFYDGEEIEGVDLLPAAGVNRKKWWRLW